MADDGRLSKFRSQVAGAANRPPAMTEDALIAELKTKFQPIFNAVYEMDAAAKLASADYAVEIETIRVDLQANDWWLQITTSAGSKLRALDVHLKRNTADIREGIAGMGLGKFDGHFNMDQSEEAAEALIAYCGGFFEQLA